MSGSELEIDEHGEVSIINDTEMDDQVILKAIQDQIPELASITWGKNPFDGGKTRRKHVFEQNRYVAPNNIFDEFRLAAHAAKYDDIVSNAVDTTENLAFKRVAVETDSDEENDIWAQIIDEMDLTQRMREMWRDQFIYSQFYFAVLWQTKTFKLKRKGDSGTKRKKQYRDLKVPRGISLLDPTKVIPVGTFMFNQEQLVYIANKDEYEGIENTLFSKNKSNDPIVEQLFVSQWNPTNKQLLDVAALIGESGLERRRLFVLNPETVFRVTATRPAYEKFADVRMASIFELLDLKHILREMDRTEIMSATNCIILVKKGSDKWPAQKGELAAAAAQVSQSSRTTLIVSDHRFEVEIITRKTDKVLMPERYNGLDSRITARLYQILSTGNYASGTATDNSPNLFKIIASSMESRRDNIRDSLMNKVINKVWEKNDKLEEYPAMNFYPRRIALDFDNNIATFMQDLKDRNVISAETLLAEMDILLDEEINKIKREQEKYPDILQQYNVPFDGKSPAAQAAGKTGTPAGVATPTPKAAGRAGGGNNNGGGRNPDSTKPSPNNRGK